MFNRNIEVSNICKVYEDLYDRFPHTCLGKQVPKVPATNVRYVYVSCASLVVRQSIQRKMHLTDEKDKVGKCFHSRLQEAH